jgi:hypothetical protein
VYRCADDPLGRDMLLKGRFFGLRFYFGVRVTGVIDETLDGTDGPERVWVELPDPAGSHKGEPLNYEVIKNLASSQVLFRVAGYSQRAPIPNPGMAAAVRGPRRPSGRRSQRAGRRR